MGKDEKILSGDYEAATDSLPIEVAELCLKVMRETSVSVPPTVWQGALKSLRPLVEDKEGNVFVPERGQMMGSLLSFPLLCLQNYLCCSFVLGTDRPYLINGDDTLTRCTRKEYGRWLEELPKLGLRPSAGKCAFLRSVFTINSAYFQLVRRGVRRLPYFKGKGFFPSTKGVPTGDCLRAHRGGLRNGAKREFERLYLNLHARKIQQSGRSLWKLGWDVSPDVVPRWMAVREVQIRDTRIDPRPEKTIPAVPDKHNVGGIPIGWKRVAASEIPASLKPRIALFRQELGRIYAEGKEASRDLARSMSQNWREWWKEVGRTGRFPLKPKKWAVSWEYSTGQRRWSDKIGYIVKSPGLTLPRFKKEIGRYLRAIAKQRRVPTPEEFLLLPEMWQESHRLQSMENFDYKKFYIKECGGGRKGGA
jgi:hypothetical protein